MMKLFYSFLLFIFLFVFFSCSKKDENNLLSSQLETYFDLTPGKFIIYDVIEVSHDETATVQHDTVYYQMKTLIGDTIIDNEGRIARKLIRYKRNNSQENWNPTDVWTCIIEGNRAEMVEENQRIVKLMFPISLNTKWNANVFNSESANNCFYKNLHIPMQINSIQFDSTLIVEQENQRNLIEYKRKFEVYANGVGLIKKYFKDLKISNFDTLSVKSGKEFFLEVTDFGY